MAMTTATETKDDIGDFSVAMFELARQIQKEKSGLMSNHDSMEKASLQTFEKALSDIRNLVTYTRLFGLDAANEQIKKSTLDYAMAAFGSGSTTTSHQIVSNSENGKSHKIQDDSKEPIQTKLVRKTECLAP